MKLKNPILIRKLHVFYYENKWSHSEIQKYLYDHHGIEVSIRTLKRWKKKLQDKSWEGPKAPQPQLILKSLYHKFKEFVD